MRRLSKVLQDQDLSVVDAIEAVMNMEQLQSTRLDKFPMVKKVMSQVRSTSDGNDLPRNSDTPLLTKVLLF